MEVKVHEFFEVCAYDLISVDEKNFLEVHGEENVQEKDLVSPNNTLLLGLCSEPGWPFVSDEFILESVFLGHVGNEFLYNRSDASRQMKRDGTNEE